MYVADVYSPRRSSWHILSHVLVWHPLKDIIFVIKEKPHEHFTREGNDLIFAFDVPMKEALINVSLDFY